ncbi:ferredoxin-thioredoxin reductase catalytic chain, chloroplastic-like [Hordeum vulgare subsp. vulgare]|uniref:ferredoxin-thioredoxin reductase catalytic chain, chloroplastic-like n=1 Tax=Hordeum vulgare subsp. vulgare TaxID=112509 RepID=UPI001D1A5866|nr:ferredoxin-thioredoxin reductase catalytic chain, chloroplastic-like [Hordeum vulgare subsp. vulgare]
MAYPWRCAIAITPSGVRLLLLWCPPLVSHYPFLLPPSPLDPPTATTDDVHHLHRRDPALPAARLQGRTARRQMCRLSPSFAAAGDGGAVDSSEQKSVEIMCKFSEQYARRSSTFFCSDKSVTAVVIKGLADHKDQLGAPLCPCRHYDDKAAEAAQGFWNCPCVPMRERFCYSLLQRSPRNSCPS